MPNGVSLLLHQHHLLVNRDPGNRQDQYRRSGTQHFYKWAKLIHPGHDFHLFPGHVWIGVAQKQLVILLHRQSATVDQESNQGRCEHTPCDQKHDQTRHSPHLVQASVLYPSGPMKGPWAGLYADYSSGRELSKEFFNRESPAGQFDASAIAESIFY